MQEIAKHHGVKPENILLTAGSGEVLDVVGTAFLPAGKKVLGVEPSLRLDVSTRHQHQVDAIKLPLGRLSLWTSPAMIQGRERERQPVGFVHSSNPEQPDGVITKQEVKQLPRRLAGMPVLIDEVLPLLVVTTRTTHR